MRIIAFCAVALLAEGVLAQPNGPLLFADRTDNNRTRQATSVTVQTGPATAVAIGAEQVMVPSSVLGGPGVIIDRTTATATINATLASLGYTTPTLVQLGYTTPTLSAGPGISVAVNGSNTTVTNTGLLTTPTLIAGSGISVTGLGYPWTVANTGLVTTPTLDQTLSMGQEAYRTIRFLDDNLYDDVVFTDPFSTATLSLPAVITAPEFHALAFAAGSGHVGLFGAEQQFPGPAKLLAAMADLFVTTSFRATIIFEGLERVLIPSRVFAGRGVSVTPTGDGVTIATNALLTTPTLAQLGYTTPTLVAGPGINVSGSGFPWTVSNTGLVTTPTLQQVTDAGDTTTRTINARRLATSETLWLNGVTADPSLAGDGSQWYRADRQTITDLRGGMEVYRSGTIASLYANATVDPFSREDIRLQDYIATFGSTVIPSSLFDTPQKTIRVVVAGRAFVQTLGGTQSFGFFDNQSDQSLGVTVPTPITGWYSFRAELLLIRLGTETHYSLIAHFGQDNMPVQTYLTSGINSSFGDDGWDVYVFWHNIDGFDPTGVEIDTAIVEVLN